MDASPDGSVELLHHNPGPSPVELAVADYFNLGVDLGELWRGFADVDPRFAELAGRFGGGARVLRQDPVECLFQFLCSSNNNIGRIEKMVGVISSFGRRLGRVGGFEFYEFPTIERLALVTEAELREAGFGYRYGFNFLFVGFFLKFFLVKKFDSELSYLNYREKLKTLAVRR